MSQRKNQRIGLLELLNRVVAVEGSRGKARLSMAANRGEKMIDRYRKGESVPPSDVARALAVACGCSDDEATDLAIEWLQKANDRTA